MKSGNSQIASVTLDRPNDPAIGLEDTPAYEHDHGEAKTRFYCFKLFSWRTRERMEELLTWFLLLRLSPRDKGAYEKVGAGVVNRYSLKGDMMGRRLFEIAKTETIDII